MKAKITCAPLAEDALQALSDCVMRLGPIIDEAARSGPLDDWVHDNLPMRPATARRIRAMWLAWKDYGDSGNLPEPWKAMWTID